MPRRKRLKRARSAPAVLHRQSNRPAKQKQWKEESMIAALKAVREGEEGVNRVAALYGVPRTTLKDRLSGSVTHGVNPGPRPYLDSKEEKNLSEHLIEAAKLGYGKTRKQIKGLVETVAKEKGILKSEKVTDGWWRRFMERQPQLSLRRGDPTAHVRMNAVNKESIEGYFDLLEETLNEHDLLNSPGQLYNMDESGVPLDSRPPNVIAKRGQKSDTEQLVTRIKSL